MHRSRRCSSIQAGLCRVHQWCWVLENVWNSRHSITLFASMPRTPGGPACFTVTFEDGIHSMSSCKPVECGVAPVSACAMVNTGAGQALSFRQEVTYDCQLVCHVGSNWSKKCFSRRCQKDGMFDGDLERNSGTLSAYLGQPGELELNRTM